MDQHLTLSLDYNHLLNTVSVWHVCTIVGEGPMATVPSGMTMTSPGTPTRVQSITATRTTTSSVDFSWNAAQFNDASGTYEVSYCTYTNSLLNGFKLMYTSPG